MWKWNLKPGVAPEPMPGQGWVMGRGLGWLQQVAVSAAPGSGFCAHRQALGSEESDVPRVVYLISSVGSRGRLLAPWELSPSPPCSEGHGHE